MRKPKLPPVIPDSRVVIIQLFGEYLCRVIVVGTASLALLLTLAVWLLQGFFDKKFIDVRDLMIVAGFGFTAIIGSFFKPVKKPSGR